MNITATYISADQDWSVGATKYWFNVSGDINGEYAIVESGRDVDVLDSDGAPLDGNEYERAAILRACVVTDEMRQKASGL